jgi:GPH family glycoside/pentoside/hexuronide:cation symporter
VALGTEAISVSEETAADATNRPLKFARAQHRVGKVPFRTKFFQGFSALPGQHKEWAFTTLLLLYYSQVLGLSASIAAAVLAVSLVIDAISDPMAGAFSDSFRSRFGRRHSLMLISIAPTCISMHALFAPPEDLSTVALAAWMLICTVSLRVSFSFFAVPWGAIAAELSEDYLERTMIIAYRMMIGGFGGVIFIFSVYSIFPASEAFENGLFDPANYRPFAWIVSALMFLWMTFSTLSTLDQVKYLPQPTDAVSQVSFKDMLSRTIEALKNKYFRVLFIATMIAAAVIGTGQVFDTYMNTFFWGFGPEELKWFSLSFLGMAFAIFTIRPLQSKFEKRDIMLVAITTISLLQILKVSLRFAGWLPENGDPLLLQLLIAHAALMGYCYFLTLMMFASMMADIADHQELQNGLRQEGIFSGGIAFSGKVTTGLGLVLGGLLLDWVIAFPVGLQPGEVAQDVLVRMAVIDGVIMPALNVIPFLLLLKYKLDRTAVRDIQHELRELKLKTG